MPEKLFTLEEAATYLGVSTMTLYRRMKTLKVKPVNYNPLLKRQKEPKYSKAQLDELKENCANAA